MWKYHIEVDPTATAASAENSSTMNERGQQTSSADVNRDYISIEDVLDHIGDDGGGRDGEQVDVVGPKDADIFKNIANYIRRFHQFLEIHASFRYKYFMSSMTATLN